MQDRGKNRTKGPDAILEARNKGEGSGPLPSATAEEAERKLAKGFSREIMVDAELDIGDGKPIPAFKWVEIRSETRLMQIVEIAARNRIGLLRR